MYVGRGPHLDGVHIVLGRSLESIQWWSCKDMKYLQFSDFYILLEMLNVKQTAQFPPVCGLNDNVRWVTNQPDLAHHYFAPSDKHFSF